VKKSSSSIFPSFRRKPESSFSKPPGIVWTPVFTGVTTKRDSFHAFSGGKGQGRGDLSLISIIIPTLNEEDNIAGCLASTQNASNAERIVVDGGSRDRTVEIARACGATVITIPSGRARQMNAGAKVASGDLLIFLHADTRLPERFDSCVRQILARPGIAAGAFEFCLDMSSAGLRIIERVANWRSRRLQMPYGDQAIFIRSAVFRDIGGFPDMPIMEDFEFIRRLKKRGHIHTAPHPAITSARRWRMLGLWKTTLINELVVVAYYLGLSPARIHRWARRNR
jgi:rSAM/selenodomain-associated transferase 2